MSSYSGLPASKRIDARKIVAAYCRALLANPSQVFYTQSFGGRAGRWSGIEFGHDLRHLTPYYGDCSSTATFILWRALTHQDPKIKDIVNGANWQAGYTGTLLNHGKRVVHEKNVLVGDLVLYGNGGTGEHVAVCVGGGRVFSHGSMAGPFLLPIHYRSDVMSIRRYI